MTELRQNGKGLGRKIQLDKDKYCLKVEPRKHCIARMKNATRQTYFALMSKSANLKRHGSVGTN
jgi:hypothetical protein